MALPLFDTIIQPITISASTELSLALGSKTLVFLTGASSFSLYGIAAVGGNQDGMVVVLCNVCNAAVNYAAQHESGLASAAANRFLHANLVAVTIGVNTPLGGIGSGVGGAAYRYFGGSINRWILMSHT